MRAQYYATVLPLIGTHLESYPGDLPAALRKIRVMHHKLFNRLYAAGCAELQSACFMYTRNCPPCAVKVKPWKRPCRRSVCEFCHGRRVAEVFLKFNTAAQSRDCAVATILKHRGYTENEYIPVRTDRNGSLETSVRRLVAEEQQFARELRDKHLPETFGGFHWHTIAPDVRTAKRVDSAGQWIRVHSVAALVPAGFKADADEVFVINNPSPYRLAILLGNLFKYRIAWMLADPVILAEYLNCVKRTRFLNPFGYFKRANTS